MNERHRRQVQQLRAEQDVVRRAADVVQAAPDGTSWAVLNEPAAAFLLASVLDEAADRLDSFDRQLREHVVRISAELVGDRMDRPSVRRTRRR